MTHGKNGSYVAGCRCEPCKDAHAEYMREYRRRRGARPRRTAGHGTSTTLYQKGCRCEACREAYSEWQQERRQGLSRRRMLAKQGAWNIGDRVTDLLVVDGGWWTTQALADRFGHHPDSIMRALRPLDAEGILKRRVIELAATKPGHPGHDYRVEWKAT